MEIALISATAALASLLTFFTGFGLATILTPVMLVFFPAPTAIALTAIVHFLNNLFKYALMRTHIEWRIVVSFGIPAGFGALAGAGLLYVLPSAGVITGYSLAGKIFHVTALKLTLGGLMIFFALFEAIPRLKNIQFSANKIYAGGFISGFFGGLSGHQGALRSAFLIRAGLTKEIFIGTGIAIACIVDAVRLLIYRPFSNSFSLGEHGYVLAIAAGSAFAGALMGNLMLKKTELKTLQWLVALGVSVIGLAMAAGLV